MVRGCFSKENESLIVIMFYTSIAMKHSYFMEHGVGAKRYPPPTDEARENLKCGSSNGAIWCILIRFFNVISCLKFCLNRAMLCLHNKITLTYNYEMWWSFCSSLNLLQVTCILCFSKYTLRNCWGMLYFAFLPRRGKN